MSLYRIAYHHVNHCVGAHTSSFNLNKHYNFHRNVAKLGRWIALLFFEFNVNVSADFAAEFVSLAKTKNAAELFFDKFRVNNELKTRLMTRKVKLISRWCGNIGRGCLSVHSLPRNAFHWAVINLCFNVALCTSRPPSQTSIMPFITEKRVCGCLLPKTGARKGFDMNLMLVSSASSFHSAGDTPHCLVFDTSIYKLAVNFHMNALDGNANSETSFWCQKWRVSSPREKLQTE